MPYTIVDPAGLYDPVPFRDHGPATAGGGAGQLSDLLRGHRYGAR
jgi:hypothetical protein